MYHSLNEVEVTEATLNLEIANKQKNVRLEVFTCEDIQISSKKLNEVASLSIQELLGHFGETKKFTTIESISSIEISDDLLITAYAENDSNLYQLYFLPLT